MNDRLTYWKCPKCHGTGKTIPIPGRVEDCFDCDGTGNALVDGKARAHEREVNDILAGRMGDSIEQGIEALRYRPKSHS